MEIKTNIGGNDLDSFADYRPKSLEELFVKPPITIPILPSLDLMKNHLKPIVQELGDLNTVYVLGIQHMLESTASLLNSLIELGFNPEDMRFAGKPYSDCPEVVEAIKNLGIKIEQSPAKLKLGNYQQYSTNLALCLWESCIKDIKKNPKIRKIIILDEGGKLLSNIPKRLLNNSEIDIVGVEQTRNGLYHDTAHVKTIEIASSAVKIKLESPLIVSAICDVLMSKLNVYGFSQNAVFGIVGNGAIGLNLSKLLLSKGFTVLVYDKNSTNYNELVKLDNKKLHIMRSIEGVFENADCIVGCTGIDITKNLDFNIITRPLMLFSATSGDVEFNTLLSIVANKLDSFKVHEILKIDPLDDLKFIINGVDYTLANSGTPINFNRSRISVETKYITLTRLLIEGAIFQALYTLFRANLDADISDSSEGERIMLDPYMQKFCVELWDDSLDEEAKFYQKKEVEKYLDIDTIIKDSHVPNALPPKYEEIISFKNYFLLEKNVTHK